MCTGIGNTTGLIYIKYATRLQCRWASFLSLITSLKRWLTVRTRERRRSFIQEFLFLKTGGREKSHSPLWNGKNFLYFFSGVIFVTQVVSDERISNTRSLELARRAEWMAKAPKEQISPPELRLWPLQGQKQTKVLRIGFFFLPPPTPSCPESRWGGVGGERFRQGDDFFKRACVHRGAHQLIFFFNPGQRRIPPDWGCNLVTRLRFVRRRALLTVQRISPIR